MSVTQADEQLLAAVRAAGVRKAEDLVQLQHDANEGRMALKSAREEAAHAAGRAFGIEAALPKVEQVNKCTSIIALKSMTATWTAEGDRRGHPAFDGATMDAKKKGKKKKKKDKADQVFFGFPGEEEGSASSGTRGKSWGDLPAEAREHAARLGITKEKREAFARNYWAAKNRSGVAVAAVADHPQGQPVKKGKNLTRLTPEQQKTIEKIVPTTNADGSHRTPEEMKKEREKVATRFLQERGQVPA